MHTDQLAFISSPFLLQHLCEVIPLLVMCSRSVHEVYSLVSRIRTGLSPHGLIKTVELFYCLATLFFALWTKGLLPPRSTAIFLVSSCVTSRSIYLRAYCNDLYYSLYRYHYFLFYSLNILERSELCQSTQALKPASITPSSSCTVR